MSELLEKIKKDQLQARKDRDTFTANALTTLIGEASPSGNEKVTDEQVQAVVKKFIKNLDEMLSYYDKEEDAQTHYELMNGVALYKTYLPKQIEGGELEEVIEDLITNGCDNIGKVMKALNSKYKGQFDGKEASMAVKRLLS